jgi:hypothetical protein
MGQERLGRLDLVLRIRAALPVFSVFDCVTRSIWVTIHLLLGHASIGTEYSAVAVGKLTFECQCETLGM